ncbi:lysoplasmalogenase [Alteromonas gracilis]|uniref:lysoplasmalogenase n=1 Tax=Alteromonas gracilis TaxID=1479524 RepID=UPI0030D56357
MPNYMSFVYALCAFTYLGSLSFTPYPGQFVVKALPILLLSFFSFISLKSKLKAAVVFALFASAAGDIFLALTFEGNFVLGLGCFLVAHIAYIVSFFIARIDRQGRQMETQRNPALLGVACAFVVGFSVLMAQHILPAAGDLFYPVFIYIMVITTMGITALVVARSWYIALGALVFVTSDAILAQTIFIKPITLSGFAVMLTYYAAQYLLTRGFIQAARTEQLER